MKQHITIEQLEKSGLTSKLRDILKDEYFGGDNHLHEKITIGKMIEILLKFSKVDINQECDYWVTYIGSLAFFELELVDSLWEAVKEVLDEE